ncbi:MAG: SLC13 family permease [Phycisphaerae bacterium]
MRPIVRVFLVSLSLVVFVALRLIPWHEQPQVRAAVALVGGTLVLWIGEVAPLGVTALAIPLVAAISGALTWEKAISAWSDRTVFLFLGAFLLARALDKHRAFDRLLTGEWGRRWRGTTGVALALVVMMLSGALSTFQNNTAVAAMLLPAVTVLARQTRFAALPLMALSFGATFGGMATPIGTAPNMIGFDAMKARDASINFLDWMRVGVPAWLGTTLIACTVLAIARRGSVVRASSEPDASMLLVQTDVGPSLSAAGPIDTFDELHRRGRRWAVAAMCATALLWLAGPLVSGLLGKGHVVQVWVETYLHESMPPILAALLLFLAPINRRGATVLDRHDFQALDWDTLFLIAGGLCLGRVLDASGAARELAGAVASTSLSSAALMLALGAATVLLSELTSNTATAALMVPIAAPMAAALGLSQPKLIWMVALCASLGFALPVSTPPNALVYSTRLIPVRFMLVVGVLVDALSLVWVVTCVRWLA